MTSRTRNRPTRTVPVEPAMCEFFKASGRRYSKPEGRSAREGGEPWCAHPNSPAPQGARGRCERLRCGGALARCELAEDDL